MLKFKKILKNQRGVGSILDMLLVVGLVVAVGFVVVHAQAARWLGPPISPTALAGNATQITCNPPAKAGSAASTLCKSQPLQAEFSVVKCPPGNQKGPCVLTKFKSDSKGSYRVTLSPGTGYKVSLTDPLSLGLINHEYSFEIIERHETQLNMQFRTAVTATITGVVTSAPHFSCPLSASCPNPAPIPVQSSFDVFNVASACTNSIPQSCTETAGSTKLASFSSSSEGKYTVSVPATANNKVAIVPTDTVHYEKKSYITTDAVNTTTQFDFVLTSK